MTAPELLGRVSTEGGPLLIADRKVAAKWNGAFGAGKDYERACGALAPVVGSGALIDVDEEAAVVWDIPTGTAEIWRRAPDEVVVTHSHLDAESDLARFLASLPLEQRVPIGRLRSSSGWIVIVWAAEAGDKIGAVEPADGRALDLSVGNAGIVVAAPPGAYACTADEVRDGSDASLRCVIARARLG